jgi:hypothetical protein
MNRGHSIFSGRVDLSHPHAAIEFCSMSCYLCWRSSLADSHRARVQRGESATARCASTGNRLTSFIFSSLPLPTSHCRGRADGSSTARIEGPPLYRGASASKKDRLASFFPFPIFILLSFGGRAPMLLQLRPSNEALRRARVPGAREQCGCPAASFLFSFSPPYICRGTDWLFERASGPC